MKIIKPNHKILRITKENIFSWKKRLTTFVGVFSIIWLFIDPLLSFSIGTSLIKTFGSWGYIGLLLLSVIIVVSIEVFLRILEIRRMDLISLIIIFTESGTIYDVEAPQDMRTGIFISLLFDKLANFTSESIITRREIYDFYLLVQRNETYEPISPYNTFREAKISKNDKFIIRGDIKKEHQTIQGAAQQEFKTAHISLAWQESPRDLDLFLSINLDNKANLIFHGNHGNLNEAPWVFLERDVRGGFGPETIQISHWLNGKYTCLVQNFSGEKPLAGSGATVEFMFNGNIRKFICPQRGIGNTWTVFTYDSQTKQIELINTISNKQLR